MHLTHTKIYATPRLLICALRTRTYRFGTRICGLTDPDGIKVLYFLLRFLALGFNITVDKICVSLLRCILLRRLVFGLENKLMEESVLFCQNSFLSASFLKLGFE